MPRRRAGALSYAEAVHRSRGRVGTLSLEAGRGIQQALRVYASELARGVGQLQTGLQGPDAQATRRLVLRTATRLDAALTDTVGDAREAAFDDVLRLWQQAAEEAHAAQDAGHVVTAPPLTLLGAYERLGGAATWRTRLTGHVQASAEEVDALVRVALLEGVSADELARRLRPYVQGAEAFHRAFGGAAFQRVRDLRGHLPPELREAARRLKHNALRIAMSELHNARWEAELTHFAVDPLIHAARWRLSPQHEHEGRLDICDVMATADWYGLGPGVYPLSGVPAPAHPFDQCELEPVRGAYGARKPTPLAVLAPDDLVLPKGLTAAAAARLRLEAARLMGGSDAHHARGAMLRLLDAARGAGTRARAKVPATAPKGPPAPFAPQAVPLEPPPAWVAERYLHLRPGDGRTWASKDALLKDILATVPQARVDQVIWDYPALVPGRLAEYDPYTHVMRVGPKITADAVRAARGENDPLTFRAVQVLLHETVHAESPLRPGQYKDFYGRYIEEGVVEHRSRYVAARAFFPEADTFETIPPAFAGKVLAYPSETSTMRWMASRLGEGAVEAVWRRATADERREALERLVRDWIDHQLTARLGLSARDRAKVTRVLEENNLWLLLTPPSGSTQRALPPVEGFATAGTLAEVLALLERVF